MDTILRRRSETLTPLCDCVVDYALVQAFLLIRDDNMISCIETFKAVDTRILE